MKRRPLFLSTNLFTLFAYGLKDKVETNYVISHEYYIQVILRAMSGVINQICYGKYGVLNMEY